METSDFSFIDEPIEVIFHEEPLFSKVPPCPNAFIWREEFFPVIEMLETWQDYKRRGRYARNMREEHLRVALRRGSWGVGRFHFRVLVPEGRVFQIYYDRAPENVNDRSGSWFLFGEKRQSV